MFHLDLRKLEHAVALADALHFGRACARVNLSQPALSRSIQVLEDNLGAELFVRSPRRVELTPFGVVVIERARRILFETAQMTNELRLMKDAAYGNIVFGLGATPAALLASHMFGALPNSPTGASVAIRRGATENLVQMLYADEVDIVCADVSPLDALDDLSRLDIQDLPQWPTSMFCRPEHPILRSGNAVSREDVCRYPFASPRLSRFAVAAMQLELKTSEGFPKRVAMESDSFDDLIAAAEATDVILVGNRPVLAHAIQSGRLRELPLEPPISWRPRFGIVRLAGGRLPPLGEILIDLVRTTFEAHAARYLSK